MAQNKGEKRQKTPLIEHGRVNTSFYLDSSLVPHENYHKNDFKDIDPQP